MLSFFPISSKKKEEEAKRKQEEEDIKIQEKKKEEARKIQEEEEKAKREQEEKARIEKEHMEYKQRMEEEHRKNRQLQDEQIENNKKECTILKKNHTEYIKNEIETLNTKIALLSNNIFTIKQKREEYRITKLYRSFDKQQNELNNLETRLDISKNQLKNLNDLDDNQYYHRCLQIISKIDNCHMYYYDLSVPNIINGCFDIIKTRYYDKTISEKVIEKMDELYNNKRSELLRNFNELKKKGLNRK